MKANINTEKRGSEVVVVATMIAAGLVLTMWSVLHKIGLVGF